MRRLISNIEVEKIATREFIAGANFLLVELSVQAQHETHLWAGRTTHKLRWVNGQLKLVEKKVVLVNAAEPIANLSFLI
jgi:3-phenylpropionate/cinnamic acid dioxygenase small subunit